MVASLPQSQWGAVLPGPVAVSQRKIRLPAEGDLVLYRRSAALRSAALLPAAYDRSPELASACYDPVLGAFRQGYRAEGAREGSKRGAPGNAGAGELGLWHGGGAEPQRLGVSRKVGQECRALLLAQLCLQR